MKRFTTILILTGLCTALSVSAQTAGDGQTQSIFEALESYRPGQGEVVIHQSDAIRKQVSSRRFGSDVTQVDGENYLKMQGYRTQVYSGNHQRTSKEEAFRREKEIKERYPGLPVYVTYFAPFWKVRVGDYRSHEEAYQMKLELAKVFPAFGKEMIIVREEIQIPLF